jgi:hypothetical protein
LLRWPELPWLSPSELQRTLPPGASADPAGHLLLPCTEPSDRVTESWPNFAIDTTKTKMIVDYIYYDQDSRAPDAQ